MTKMLYCYCRCLKERAAFRFHQAHFLTDFWHVIDSPLTVSFVSFASTNQILRALEVGWSWQMSDVPPVYVAMPTRLSTSRDTQTEHIENLSQRCKTSNPCQRAFFPLKHLHCILSFSKFFFTTCVVLSCW